MRARLCFWPAPMDWAAIPKLLQLILLWGQDLFGWGWVQTDKGAHPVCAPPAPAWQSLKGYVLTKPDKTEQSWLQVG